jgi:hypothetical protein
MLAITYSMKKEIKVAKRGTPKKYLKKQLPGPIKTNSARYHFRELNLIPNC